MPVADSLRGFAKQTGGNLRNAASLGVAGAVSAVGLGLAEKAVMKLHDALTKRRDFRAMLEANPHLQKSHDQDPKFFNQLFSTLRTFNPAFSADPIVSGGYMSRMVAHPEGAGGIAAETLMARDKMPTHMHDMFQQVSSKMLDPRHMQGEKQVQQGARGGPSLTAAQQHLPVGGSPHGSGASVFGSGKGGGFSSGAYPGGGGGGPGGGPLGGPPEIPPGYGGSGHPGHYP